MQDKCEFSHKRNKELVAEAISCCKEIFKSQYDRYPFIPTKCSFDETILSIISQCSTNTKVVRNLCDFRNCFIESLPVYLSSLSDKGLDIGSLMSLVPKGCVVTTSDKNVGISLLPYEWYLKEYKIQLEKGGHERVELSEHDCLKYLSSQINIFHNLCSPEQKKLVDSLWPKENIKKHRIGVLKLVPKVHKLKGTISEVSWNDLPSRPIRGAELDPMRQPSKVLYKLLQKMLQKLKDRYSNLTMYPLKYPVLSGCDDYTHRVDNLRLDTHMLTKTVLLTADFSDAYTETGISRLQESIRMLGELLEIPYFETDVMRKLVNLVFSNCYFYTPHGLYRQTRGMPMGDISSR